MRIQKKFLSYVKCAGGTSGSLPRHGLGSELSNYLCEQQAPLSSPGKENVCLPVSPSPNPCPEKPSDVKGGGRQAESSPELRAT